MDMHLDQSPSRTDLFAHIGDMEAQIAILMAENEALKSQRDMLETQLEMTASNWRFALQEKRFFQDQAAIFRTRINELAGRIPPDPEPDEDFPRPGDFDIPSHPMDTWGEALGER